MPEREWSVAEIIQVTTDYLAKRDPSCPRLEAELLLSEVLKLNRINLYVNFERILTEAEVKAYRELIKRRGAHEPVAYILGHKDFYNLSLKVTCATLIPRPETEHLVDEALRLIKELGSDNPRAADIGCGSGAIALALLSNHPSLRVSAVDISSEALAVFEENARTLKLTERLAYFCGDLALPLINSLQNSPENEKFDFICANLPYIPDSQMATLPPDVGLFEPHLALKGGQTGTDLIKKLLPQAKDILKPGGYVLLEIWPESLNEVNELAQTCGLVSQEPVVDYSQQQRIFVAKA
jgi:release factor glutamine methyltransferase